MTIRRTEAEALALLEEMKRLMELGGENPFKIRAFERALAVLEGRQDLRVRAEKGTLIELDGIGKGISEVLTEFLLHGRTTARDQLAAEMPEGFLELTRVPGLGPKKAKVVIEELGVKTLGELEYACQENRLLELKGFGEKAQKKILDGVRFLQSHSGQQKLGDVLSHALELLSWVRKLPHVERAEETGALRRRLETLSEVELLVQLDSKHTDSLKEIETKIQKHAKKMGLSLRVEVSAAGSSYFSAHWIETTGSREHLQGLGVVSHWKKTVGDEAAVYKGLGLHWIPPECRETGEELKLMRAGRFPELLESHEVKGVFHNHTSWSDGAGTIEHLVQEARRMGFQYIGISDHSQSAHYARGLSPEALKEQEREIRRVQEKYPDLRIFWGIESDILADGGLDYGPAELKRFDFVVASVHSRFGMEKREMTERIITALRNPATRFLGHATGRLLLARPGYDLDMERVIEEAAKNDVAIEINANPWRLDIDWRWGSELRKNKTLVAINPDAHSAEELGYFNLGVTVARKALLPFRQVLNSRSEKEVEKWLKRDE